MTMLSIYRTWYSEARNMVIFFSLHLQIHDGVYSVSVVKPPARNTAYFSLVGTGS